MRRNCFEYILLLSVILCAVIPVCESADLVLDSPPGPKQVGYAPADGATMAVRGGPLYIEDLRLRSPGRSESDEHKD